MKDDIKSDHSGDFVELESSDVERFRKLYDLEITEEEFMAAIFSEEYLESLAIRCAEFQSEQEENFGIDILQELRDMGLKDGSHWAAKSATHFQLSRIQSMVSRCAEEGKSWVTYGWRNCGDEETLVAKIIYPESDGRHLELFWTQFDREYSIVRSRQYLNGFIQGAISTWEAIQEHPAWTGGESK